MKDTVVTGVSINKNDTLTIYMGVNKQATFGTSANTFRVFVENVNGLGADENTANDELVIGPRFPALSGTFTINASGSGLTNFNSFTQAVEVLNG